MRRVSDRKEMRFVTARPRFVIVAANHALRFLDARIRRIFGRRVERRFLDVWPRWSVVVRGGAAAARVARRRQEALRRRRDAIDATESL